VTGVPPGRHPNWCRCQGCRENIARFESQQFKGTMVAVAVLVAITLIVMAAHAIG
jgi:hypothetical protein